MGALANHNARGQQVCVLQRTDTQLEWKVRVVVFRGCKQGYQSLSRKGTTSNMREEHDIWRVIDGDLHHSCGEEVAQVTKSTN